MPLILTNSFNLFDNAVQAMNQKGRLWVGTKYDTKRRRVVGTVADEGPGIAPELREQVFQKFFRIPGRESVDPRRTGIGLGLPLAKRLVEAQAGQIAIEAPASGRGTSVVLTLPCVAQEAGTEETQAPQPALRA